MFICCKSKIITKMTKQDIVAGLLGGIVGLAGAYKVWQWVKDRNSMKVPLILTERRPKGMHEKHSTLLATEKPGFLEVFEELCEEFVQDLAVYDLSHVSSKALRRMITYNLPGGKLNRGLTVVQTAMMINKNGDREFMRRASVLGWCIEWLQASFLVADDLMDSSITRRGQPCWYKNEDVGLIAVNDAIILMTQVDILLHKYFGHDTDMFMKLHRIMTETTYQTEMGQFLDLSTQPPQGPINLNLYTEERHNLIVKYKTAFYSFYAPIALGMVLSGVDDDESLRVAREICVEMGVYFQVQDDYLDCYGAPEVIGKIGTDVQDSKCSWLVVNALKRANATQKATIHANYGKDDETCINKVKAVYKELNMEQLYEAYEQRVYKDLCDRINNQVHTVPKEVFFGLLNKIYKRSK